jgi:Pvc16 N-terminal domain
MADLGAVHSIGETIVSLLTTRRSLLAAENRLSPVPADAKIHHVPLATLVGPTPPTGGLSITCFHIGRSDHTLARQAMQDPSQSAGISLELSYLMASWSSTTSDELSLFSWAMLELNRFPVLDSGQLPAAGWDRGESVQLVPDQADPERLFRIWDALGPKYRLSTLFKARVVRIGYGPLADALPVAASRFSFAHGDPATEPAS